MNRKIIAFIATLISILSIVVVSFFGIKATEVPSSIPVEGIVFVNHEGGKYEDRVTKRLTTLTQLEETMELHYYIFPDDATNQALQAQDHLESGFNGFDVETPASVKLDANRKGVIIIDFQSRTYSKFELTIRTKDGSKEAKRSFKYNLGN